MRMSFHSIAYEALDICNPLDTPAIDRMIERLDLSGRRALDIGCGNAAVSIRLAQRFDLEVTAVELDPAIAALAAQRIAAAGADRVVLHQGRAGEVLETSPPFDLIVALGTTDPNGDGRRAPADMFSGLRGRLTPDGCLLWGDLVWTAPPPEPLRIITEMTNTYASDEGWREAAAAAGLDVLAVETSSNDQWDRYLATMQGAVGAWLEAHPEHQNAADVRMTADRIRTLFDFGRPFLGFGLYLLRRR